MEFDPDNIPAHGDPADGEEQVIFLDGLLHEDGLTLSSDQSVPLDSLADSKELPELPPAQEHRRRVTDFFAQLIDDRFEIRDTLAPIASQSFFSEGALLNIKSIPAVLLPYIGSEQMTATVSLTYKAAANEFFIPEMLTLQLEDGATLSLTYDSLATEIKVNDESVDLVYGDEPFHDVLRSLLPHDKQDVTVSQIAEAVRTFSPSSVSIMEIAKDNIKFCFTETETPDNSIHTFTIETRTEHPSGKTLQLQAFVQEALEKDSEGHTSRCDIELHAGRPIQMFLEEVLDGKTIRVERPTKLHTDAIQDAVGSLFEDALLPRDTEHRS